MPLHSTFPGEAGSNTSRNVLFQCYPQFRDAPPGVPSAHSPTSVRAEVDTASGGASLWMPRRPLYARAMHRATDASRIAAFFDLDKTVIAGSSVLAFSRPFYRSGLLELRDVVRSAYGQCVYLVAGADHDRMERFRAEMGALVRGWQVDKVRETVARSVHEVVGPMIYPEALALIADHHEAGHDVILISSSGQEVVEPIGRMLGVDRVIATRLVVQGGHYTGEIDFYAYAENKVVAMKELAAQESYDLRACYGYSDSITDLPLLRAVGRPSVVNPDRALRRVAVDSGWPILDFRRPAREQHGQVLRAAVRASRSGADLAVAGLTVAGLVWAGRRARPRGNTARSAADRIRTWSRRASGERRSAAASGRVGSASPAAGRSS